MNQHLNIKIFGQVQGVSFRYQTQQQAQQLGLFGWVKNLGDNSVYIEVEGKEELLKQFLKWCQQGSWRAMVDKIQVTESEVKNFTNFRIEY